MNVGVVGGERCATALRHPRDMGLTESAEREA